MRCPSLVIGGPLFSVRHRSSVRSQTFSSAAASFCVRKSAKRFSVLLMCRCEFISRDDNGMPAKKCGEDFTNFGGDYSLQRRYVEGRKRLFASAFAQLLACILENFEDVILPRGGAHAYRYQKVFSEFSKRSGAQVYF
jgi:hypothetical protein